METAPDIKPHTDERQAAPRFLRWIAAVVIALGALLLAAGGPLTVSPLQSVPAAYLTDRNLALAVILVWALVWASPRVLGLVVLVSAVMHGVDVLFDVLLRNIPAAAGSAVFAAVFLVVGLWLLRQRGGSLLRRSPVAGDRQSGT